VAAVVVVMVQLVAVMEPAALQTLAAVVVVRMEIGLLGTAVQVLLL
jgi:hypothetical protein